MTAVRFQPKWFAAALIGIGWILGFHGCSFAAAEFGTAAKPSMSIPVTGFDFGEVVEGAEVTHEFIVKNSGNATLEIRKVTRD